MASESSRVRFDEFGFLVQEDANIQDNRFYNDHQESQITEHWKRVCKNWNSDKNLTPKKLLGQGVPNSMRSEIWRKFLNAEQTKSQATFNYQEHIDRLYSKLQHWNLTDVANEKNIQAANALLEEHLLTMEGNDGGERRGEKEEGGREDGNTNGQNSHNHEGEGERGRDVVDEVVGVKREKRREDSGWKKREGERGRGSGPEVERCEMNNRGTGREKNGGQAMVVSVDYFKEDGDQINSERNGEREERVDEGDKVNGEREREKVGVREKKKARREMTEVRRSVWTVCSERDFVWLKMSRQIMLDVIRTFPTHRLFMGETAAKISLYRILMVYAEYNPSVGYCQGMAYVVGLLVMYMQEEDAFWSAVSLFEWDKYLAGFYDNNLTKIHGYADVFSLMLKKRQPQLSQHLDSLSIHPLMFMTSWFMCLFTSLPCWDTVLAICDLIFLEGVHSLFRVAIAIMSVSSDELLAMYQLETILPFIQKLPPRLVCKKVLMPEIWRTSVQMLEVQNLQEEVTVKGRERLSPKRRAPDDHLMSTPAKRRKVQESTPAVQSFFSRIKSMLTPARQPLSLTTNTTSSTYNSTLKNAASAKTKKRKPIKRSPHFNKTELHLKTPPGSVVNRSNRKRKRVLMESDSFLSETCAVGIEMQNFSQQLFPPDCPQISPVVSDSVCGLSSFSISPSPSHSPFFPPMTVSGNTVQEHSSLLFNSPALSGTLSHPSLSLSLSEEKPLRRSSRLAMKEIILS